MTEDIRKIALIPAYKPSGMLIDILAGLKERGFDIITVNDGSGDEFDDIFLQAKEYSTVLKHNVNLGKGAALKTGLCFIRSNYHEPYVVVTLDADGQHCTEDVCRTAEAAVSEPDALVIGARAFRGKVPLKSRLGNGITRAVFALSSGKMLTDTQTGLRAFSDRHVARMLDINGDRYEYEMNVLMDYAKAKIPIREVPIETIYIDGNSSSHFRPVRDSYRIYKEIIKFSLSSLLSFGIDYVLFCILSAFTGQIAFSNIAARLVSATVNFEVNRRVVFGSKKSVAKSALAYIALALFILACGTLLVTFLTSEVGLSPFIAKLLTESSMFVLSYAVQHSAVFAGGESNKDKKGAVIYMKHRYVWAVGYGAALALFTGYVMLDTFIIPSVAVADASAVNTAMFDEVKTSDTRTVSDDSSTEKKENPEPAASEPEDKRAAPRPDSSGSEKKRPSGKQPGSTDGSTESSSGKRGGGSKKPSSRSKENAVLTTSESSDGKSYSDENISVNISEYYENDTRIYVADVRLSSAQYLKTAFAKDSYGKNITASTSETAAAKNAILAINGDYYGARESGYVIRNGIVYRSTGSADTDVLCIYTDGHFEITNSSEKTAEELLEEGVWQAFSFGPALIVDGEISVTKGQEVGKAMASNPRTAIGIIDDLHYVFVVADGRTSESSGLSLSELASFMQKLGAATAYNLDGGGSTTMYFDGKVINNPTTGGNSIKERNVSDIVYIG